MKIWPLFATKTFGLSVGFCGTRDPRANFMMTSSNGTVFRFTGPLCGEFTGPGDFPAQRPVTRSFNVFFDPRLYKRLNKQPRGCWFQTPPRSIWCKCNVFTHHGTNTIHYSEITASVLYVLIPNPLWFCLRVFPNLVKQLFEFSTAGQFSLLKLVRHNNFLVGFLFSG